MHSISIFQGGVADDDRGQIRFVNEFDMGQVKRFYIIKNRDTKLVRGWRGHRIEQRWFYAISGSFKLHFVSIDNWEVPSPDLFVKEVVLKSSDMQVVHVPAGYCMACRALEENSELLVYADYSFEHALVDDYKWPESYFYKSRIWENTF